MSRITFIVNIKAEKEIAGKEDCDIYSIAFDYVLNLKEINIDNYGIILNKLLENNRKRFEEHQIPVFGDDGKYIRIIRGNKIGIRENCVEYILRDVI